MSFETTEEVYDFIGELAIALYSKKIQISLGSLRSILADKGKDYNNNRGMASGVSAAYRRWKDKDPVVYHAIAYTYVDNEGGLAWDKRTTSKNTMKLLRELCCFVTQLHLSFFFTLCRLKV